MQKHHRVIRIIVAGIIIVVIALAVGFLVNSKTASAPTPISKQNNVENPEQEVGQVPTQETQASSSLNKINATSKVNADIDAYLNSSNSVSNPNDFNDSYSDLNQ